MRVNTVSVRENASSHIQYRRSRNWTFNHETEKQWYNSHWWRLAGTGSSARWTRDVTAKTLIPNLSLAQHVLPELSNARVTRSWVGFEANVPDFIHLLVLCRALKMLLCWDVREVMQSGPYMGRLMGDYILGQEPELPCLTQDVSLVRYDYEE